MEQIISVEELKKIHNIQLQMLDEVHRICEKFNIKYIISGGTLLGAVRNGKFIPWDDDIDIRMERGEYNKFCDVCNRELDRTKFFFQTYKTDPGYPWFYGKMRYTNSKYIRKGQEHLHMQNGIFIDIMPADGVPNCKWKRKIFTYKCYVLKKVLYSVVGYKSENKWYKRLFFKLLNYIPKKFIFSEFESMAQRYSNKKYKYVTCYSFVNPGQSEFTERNWHLERKIMPFEEKIYYIPKEYDKWLVMTYGKDYLIPPPLKERYMHNEISFFSMKGEGI